MNENVDEHEHGEERDAGPAGADDELERVERPADDGRSVVADRPVQLRRVEREQGGDLGEEAERVDAERDAGARHRDDDAADRGPEDARACRGSS